MVYSKTVDSESRSREVQCPDIRESNSPPLVSLHYQLRAATMTLSYDTVVYIPVAYAPSASKMTLDKNLSNAEPNVGNENKLLGETCTVAMFH